MSFIILLQNIGKGVFLQCRWRLAKGRWCGFSEPCRAAL